jgi:hypothetical protein
VAPSSCRPGFMERSLQKATPSPLTPPFSYKQGRPGQAHSPLWYPSVRGPREAQAQQKLSQILCRRRWYVVSPELSGC